MKRRFLTLARRLSLLLALLFVVACRYFPDLAEGYARMVYPRLSSVLSAFASCFPFPLQEILVVFLVLWLIIYPILKRKKGVRWRKILFAEAEMWVGIYVWFYLAWGLNYYRHHIYTRLQTTPATYDERIFKEFLDEYTLRLNASYQAETEVDETFLKDYIHSFYGSLPKVYGLASPEPWQSPKTFLFNPLYSKIGVLGSMGPFFSESQLNADLLSVQYPFTYAHEFSHLLGVSNEAEANYWAYRALTESPSPVLQYCGYFGLFPYVISNASSLLSEEEFREWIQLVHPEIRRLYNEKNAYWRSLYSPLIGSFQDFTYNLFLKGNKIPSGKKNYAEVIGLLLSLPQD